MDEIKKQLEIYIEFKTRIKNAKKDKKQKDYRCILTLKDNILEWKKYSLYYVFKNSSNEWELKLSQTDFNNKKPKFKIFTDYKTTKNNLENGISIINEDFIKATGYNDNNDTKKILWI